MVNVTDAAFREMFVRYGKPDVMWTEFVSADGLCSEGKDALLELLKFSKKEHPIVAQLFTGKPETMASAAKLVASLGFDGVDVNMGCPDKSIEKQGAGAQLIQNPSQALKIIEAAKEGGLPVSVKTRIGYKSKEEMDEWVKTLLNSGISALALHARTRKEMSGPPADWEAISRAVSIRDKLGLDVLIIGNGDISSKEEGIRLAKESGCDGLMVGRGVFGNPLFFSVKEMSDCTIEERLNIAIEHTKLFSKMSSRPFHVMRKHYSAYIQGFAGAKELRGKLFDTETDLEAIACMNAYIKENK